jgi:spore coat polysaccharide biosynthesis protein SpsF
MKILVVIQARMGSTRLPGKVLLPVLGRPMLERMIERVRAARTRFALCVATTTADEDEPIRALCRRLAVPHFDGHPTDLLDRHYRAGLSFDAGAVVKIPSDCPLIDPAVIDRVLGAYLARADELDFVTNLLPPSWPDGNDVEVLPMATLATAHREATSPFEREHTTPFVWRRPEMFRILNVASQGSSDHWKTHRLTVDYREDYELVERLYSVLYRPSGPVFSVEDIVERLSREPALRLHNGCHHGQLYSNLGPSSSQETRA